MSSLGRSRVDWPYNEVGKIPKAIGGLTIMTFFLDQLNLCFFLGQHFCFGSNFYFFLGPLEKKSHQNLGSISISYASEVLKVFFLLKKTRYVNFSNFHEFSPHFMIYVITQNSARLLLSGAQSTRFY
jgi:hypothetical protein